MDFVNELRALLQDNGLCDIIGLQMYEEDFVGMETTDHGTRVSTTKNYPERAPELENHANMEASSFAFF
jgi:hypothetical protein